MIGPRAEIRVQPWGFMIGDVLVKAGVLDEAGLARVLEIRARDGGSIGRIAADLGLVDEEKVARALAAGLGQEFQDLRPEHSDPPARAELPAGFCRQRKVVPLRVEGRSLRLAMADPLDHGTIQDVEFRTGKWVSVIVTTETSIRHVLKTLWPEEGGEAFDLLLQVQPEGAVEESAGTEYEVVDPSQIARDVKLPPIVRLVDKILSDAAKAGASDVHIEPNENGLQVRHRLDGMLVDALGIPNHLKAAVVSRLKIIAGMDIAERRRPQDGRSRLRLEGRRIDLRVSSLPTNFGEKVVVRLLDAASGLADIDRLDMAPDLLARFRDLLERPQGMILVTGPTGSGKSSTLYASLNFVKSRAKNLIAVEDPIEYQVAGVSQVQINTKAGVTFAAGLRSILRQDPDIVMVGEIRDRETAAIAAEAAQTGHLLLSTLHTNDAPSSITRLVDLGVEPFMVASSVIGILAQRLARRLCDSCATERAPSAEELEKIGGPRAAPPGAVWRSGSSCAACRQSGYRGRMAIHELLVADDAIRELISRRAAEHQVRESARRAGMRTLMEDGVAKAARGLTTLAEVLRVTPRDEAADAAGPSPLHGRAAAPDPARRPAPAPPSPAPPYATAGRPRVLIVDDSPTVVTVVKYFLELEGYQVQVAENGLGGLEMARQAPPDIVVSDVHMPGMDGIELTRALRQEGSTGHCGIILLTSETSVESEAMGLAIGADDFIAKPVEPRRLVARVNAILARVGARRAGAA